MVAIRYLIGDATHPVGDGQKVIVHVVNDIGAWGSGFVVAISRRWKQPEVEYRKWARGKLGPFELGMVQFVGVEPDIVVCNMVGQHNIRGMDRTPPIRYPAIRACLQKVYTYAAANKASVHGPKFGSDRAGGNWDTIEDIIREELSDKGIPVTIYKLS